MKIDTEKPQSRRNGGFWTARSDAELLAWNLYTADPTTLDNLLETVPDTDEIPEVEFAYDTLLTGTGQVRCIHCKKVAVNHNRGFVLRFSDGRRMLFGRDCGEKTYGAEFGHNRREFEQAIKRQALLKRRKHVADHCRQLSDLFEEIEAHPAWAAYGKLKRDFVAAFPELTVHLAEASERRDGALYADIQVPDHDAEAAYERRTGRKAPFFKRAQAVVHVLAGRGFFAAREAPHRAVVDVSTRARNAIWTFGDGEKTNREIELTLRSLDQIVDRLREEAERFSDVAPALSPPNIDGISHWMRETQQGWGELHLEGQRLCQCSRRGHVKEFVMRDGSDRVRRAEIQMPDPLPSAPVQKIEGIAAILSIDR